MEIGVNVWVRDQLSTSAWIPGVICRKEADGSENLMSVECEGHGVFNFRLNAEHEDSPDLKLRNAPGEGQAENLIKLPFLNEPAILHCLQERYEAGLIYTYTGPILIAVNPFKRVNLYTQAILDEYYNKGLMKSMGADVGTELSPHVYAIADNAYRQMMSVIVRGNSNDKSGDQRCNQSILISGESGAGKTESTKVVLSYLTTVGRAIDSSESFQGSIMEKVLQSNPILEAFGNAKTKRNDNSSRFGKFIQLNFNRRGNLIGGSIKTYLLEKVRLPLQQTGERNFHIFYQLVAGSSEDERRRLGLTRLEDFNYTSKSGIFLLNNVNDAEEFETLKSALSTLKFAEVDQVQLLDIVSGILHLGQLQFQSFVDGEGEGSVVEPSPENLASMELCTSLLGLTASQLTDALTIRQISAAGETYYKKMTKLQAADGRDALAKAIYGKLFDWIVATINTRIEVDPASVKANIGVLDIFGFESFAVNSFEQLCINYANETLQQQFNQFIFKLEQIEYEREKIEWSFIQFPDNKDCLELIEHKIHGIFSMLDDECRLPKASDEKFGSRMYKEYASNARFGATAAQKRSGKFSVNHYAGSVEYTVVTFVEKNKDELPKEANGLLQSSLNQLLRTFFRPAGAAATIDVDTAVISAAKRKSLGAPKPAAATVVQSVGTQFKEQLNNLMGTIYATAPHYIRCLKPNDQNIADNFTRLRITEQLRYGGVLEAVRVARSGFPVRLAHEEFYRRYRMIVHARVRVQPSNFKTFCGEFVNILHEMATTSNRMNKLEQYSFDFKGRVSLDGFQVGLTKLFLRKDSHDFLETCRYRCMHFASVQLQSFSRGCNLRVTYRNKRAAVRLIQRYFRGSIARAAVDAIRKNKAITKIQAVGRMYITMRKFEAFRYALLKLQSHWRRLVLQRLYLAKRKESASVRVSKTWRMHYQRRRYLRFLFALKKLQCKMRVHDAKQLLRKLRTEAKDLGKLQENNETLKKEIEELKARAAEERLRLQQDFERKAKESLLATKAVEMDAMKAKLQELEELLRQETRAKEEAEKRASLLELNGICRKCREKRSDESAHNQSPSLYPNGEVFDHDAASPPHSAARRNSRRGSAGDALRHAVVMGLKDPTDLLTPVKQGHNLSSTATPIKSAHIEEYKQANELLQSEIGRLRNTNIEHLATIETLKRELLRAKEEEKEKSRAEQTPKRSKGQELLRTPRRGSAKFKDVVERVASPTNVERGESPSNAPGWGNAWDAEEDDSTESGSVQDVQALTNVNTSLNSSSKAAAVTAESAAISSLEKNLEKWKAELMKGIKSTLWDGQKWAQLDVTIKLDTAGTHFQFVNVSQRRAFGLFNNKVEVSPLKVSEITECLPGAEIKVDPSEKNHLLTLIAKEITGNRVLVLKFSSPEEKNLMLSKIRAVVAASTVNIGNARLLPKAESRRPSLTVANSSPMGVSAPFEASNPLYAQRMARRPSLRETVINKSVANGDAVDVSEPAKHAEDAGILLNLRSLQHQLKDEKDALQKAKLQMAMMNGDLAEREEQISALKKSQQEVEAKLKEKDNLMKQDTMVRLQLGKRLEQVLMDKEEALEQLEQMKAQLDMISR